MKSSDTQKIYKKFNLLVAPILISDKKHWRYITLPTHIMLLTEMKILICTKYCNVFAKYCNVFAKYCNVFAKYCNVFAKYCNVFAKYCNVFAKYCNVFAKYCNVFA
ncbi:MAG: hypothetical protein KA783_11170, partial [Chitinophagales bacterium]|nr:hypothetical protein [Chitinophagales bacterium]